jgi:hypothetical protein
VTGYGLGDRGSIPEEVEDFSSTFCAQPALGPTKPLVQGGHEIFLPLVKMVTLLYIIVADDTDGCYKLQLQYPFTLLHILQHMTQAFIVQCSYLCSIILMTQNNSAPCSVGHILEHLWGDRIKSMSHCLCKVVNGLVALLCNNLLHVFTGVTRHCGHPVQWVPGILSPQVKGSWGLMLSIHLFLVPRLRQIGAIPTLPASTFHGV